MVVAGAGSGGAGGGGGEVVVVAVGLHHARAFRLLSVVGGGGW
jgi:hypothetical protein